MVTLYLFIFILKKVADSSSIIIRKLKYKYAIRTWFIFLPNRSRIPVVQATDIQKAHNYIG